MRTVVQLPAPLSIMMEVIAKMEIQPNLIGHLIVFGLIKFKYRMVQMVISTTIATHVKLAMEMNQSFFTLLKIQSKQA